MISELVSYYATTIVTFNIPGIDLYFFNKRPICFISLVVICLCSLRISGLFFGLQARFPFASVRTWRVSQLVRSCDPP